MTKEQVKQSITDTLLKGINSDRDLEKFKDIRRTLNNRDIELCYGFSFEDYEKQAFIEDIEIKILKYRK